MGRGGALDLGRLVGWDKLSKKGECRDRGIKWPSGEFHGMRGDDDIVPVMMNLGNISDTGSDSRRSLRKQASMHGI